MYRPFPGRMVIAHFNNKLIAYVNAGIRPHPVSLGRIATAPFVEEDTIVEFPRQPRQRIGKRFEAHA